MPVGYGEVAQGRGSGAVVGVTACGGENGSRGWAALMVRRRNGEWFCTGSIGRSFGDWVRCGVDGGEQNWVCEEK